MRHIDVTCALIEHDGCLLAAQRSSRMTLPLTWEFPGGKIEPGEEPKACLKRELQEELSLDVSIVHALPLSTHEYPDFSITLHPFVCSVETRELVLHEHAAVRWLAPDDLYSPDWAAADVPVLDAYLRWVKREAL